MGLPNAILPYAMAGSLVLWLIAEDEGRDSRSRVLGLVSSVILAFLFAEEGRDYHWWISDAFLVGLAAEAIAFASALLGPSRPRTAALGATTTLRRPDCRCSGPLFAHWRVEERCRDLRPNRILRSSKSNLLTNPAKHGCRDVEKNSGRRRGPL